MAWACANCGEQTARAKITFDLKGIPVRERCPHCAPEEFEGAFRDPTDNRIYSGPQAMPHMYKRDKNDVFQAKDELLADTVALWDEGPTARAVRQKRATRRTEPLSPQEIEASRRWGEDVLKPIVREGGIGAVTASLRRE